MKQQILILSELVDGKVPSTTYELMACSRILQNNCHMPVKIIVSGYKIDSIAAKLAEETGIDVIILSSKTVGDCPSSIFKYALSGMLGDLNLAYICMPHNSFGLEIAAGLAMGVHADCITGVEKITFHDNRIGFSRRIFNDKILETLTPTSSVTVLTIQPGAFTAIHENSPAKGNVIYGEAYPFPDQVRHLGYKSDKQDTSKLADAEVIVSAGNGVGKEESLELIYRLADIFPKSSVAGSRPVCDKKWLAYHQQVGATGAFVKPKLYIAAGISGASQHIAGMRESKLIVAINIDPHAAIFNFADICIIEDLTTFIPLFIDAYQNQQEHP